MVLSRRTIKQIIPVISAVFSNLVTGFMLYLVITWNFGNIQMHQYSTPHSLRPVLWMTQLDQYPYSSIESSRGRNNYDVKVHIGVCLHQDRLIFCGGTI